MQSVDKLKLIAKCLDDKKGKKIIALEVGELTSISDYFVIASGGSQTQVKALADNVTDKLAEMEIMPVHIEGYSGGSWILLDYSSVLVHVFTGEAREYYNLERLWQDARTIDISDIVE